MKNTDDAMITYLFIDFMQSIYNKIEQTEDEQEKMKLTNLIIETRNLIAHYLSDLISDKFLQIFLNETQDLIN